MMPKLKPCWQPCLVITLNPRRRNYIPFASYMSTSKLDGQEFIFGEDQEKLAASNSTVRA